MGGGGGLFSPIMELFFGKRETPDYTVPTIVQPTVADPNEEAEKIAENAAEKEAERLRKRRGQAATIVTGMKGDTSTATTLKQTLGGA